MPRISLCADIHFSRPWLSGSQWTRTQEAQHRPAERVDSTDCNSQDTALLYSRSIAWQCPGRIHQSGL